MEKVRQGPPLLLRPFDGAMNTVEYFIHVEDVRRAQDDWEPREISPELADALWARVGPGGMAKKVGATIIITSPGRADKQSGTGPALTVSGDPGELTMFGAGRQGAARVEISGDAALAAQLRPRHSASESERRRHSRCVAAGLTRSPQRGEIQWANECRRCVEELDTPGRRLDD